MKVIIKEGCHCEKTNEMRRHCEELLRRSNLRRSDEITSFHLRLPRHLRWLAMTLKVIRSLAVTSYLLATTVLLTLLFIFQAYAETSVSIDDIIDSLSDELAGDDIQSREIVTNATESVDSFEYKPKANIIILNKITAKSELIEFEIGKAQIFGNIVVEVKKCAANNNPLKSSNLMLITVFDKKLSDDKALVFAGWIDSSNLSVSTVEHPVYDVIPKGCEG